MSTISAIITILTERLLRTGSWSITAEELEEHINPVDLYRAVYQLGLIGREVYTPESAGELVGLMERVGAAEAEEQFRRAGLFLSHDDRIELTDRLVRTVRHATVVHLPEPETFRAMVRQVRRYDLAEQLYRDTFLDLEPLLRRCAAGHAEVRGGTAPLDRTAHYHTALWYARTLVDRRIVTLPDVAPALFDLLRAVARQEGALPPLSSAGKTAGRAGGRAGDGFGEAVTAADGRRGALGVLGIRSPRPGRAEIQRRYRELMRRYHPDVNPEGLEMSKRINAAYALLLTGPE